MKCGYIHIALSHDEGDELLDGHVGCDKPARAGRNVPVRAPIVGFGDGGHG